MTEAGPLRREIDRGIHLVREPRSMLFVPGDQERKLAKIPSLEADIVVVDLEDAVSVAHKEDGRRCTRRMVASLDDMTRARITVRINSPESKEGREDLRMIASLGVRGLVLPKLEQTGTLTLVREALLKQGIPEPLIFVGIESLVGVRDCVSLLASGGLAGAYFGAEDYIEDIGGVRTDDGLEVLYARSRVVMAAKLAGVAAIDQAVTAVHDLDRFKADASFGCTLGYTGKICLHPEQALASHEVFSPTAFQVQRARAIVESAEKGVQLIDGMMVDGVHVRAATRLLARHQQIEAQRN